MDEYWVGFTAIVSILLVLLALIVGGMVNVHAGDIHSRDIKVAYIQACKSTPDPTLCLTRVP